jgi:hypothetical protein
MDSLFEWPTSLEQGRGGPEDAALNRIAYSLFTPPDLDKNNRFVFDKYLLGVYFNARMNRLVYPGWQTVVFVDSRIVDQHSRYFRDLSEPPFHVRFVRMSADRPIGELLLSRFTPLFDSCTSRLLCRDLDSITTYREALAVQEWLDSGLACHTMADNVAHRDPVMAGMCGFDVKQFRRLAPEYASVKGLIDGFDLSWRGSDQMVLRVRVWPRCRKSALAHCFRGCVPSDAAEVKSDVTDGALPGVSPELRESNLVVGFIGQAGINEMEILRFFRRHDENESMSRFEDAHSDICYWRR